MQLICESYHLLGGLGGLGADALHEVFARWNKGALDSYLIDITRDIFGYRDPETGKPLVDLILDWPSRRAEESWSSMNAHSRGEAASSDDARKRGRVRTYGPGMDPLAG